MKQKSIVVVLGMHRSGTSLIARSLLTLGIDLGTRLMPPAAENNDKGFFEDVDFYALNESMLSALGANWRRIQKFGEPDWLVLQQSGYFLKAVELVRHKTAHHLVFGFKDPRTAILWPFWLRVFQHCQIQPKVVFSLRNPLSVARSLTRRDGMDGAAAYWLWAHHVLTALQIVQDEIKWAFIDYDALLENPETQLERIASALDLVLDEAALEKFVQEEIDESLRHNVYEIEDLRLDPNCPTLVYEMGSVLNQWKNADWRSATEFFCLQSAKWNDMLGQTQNFPALVDRMAVKLEDLGLKLNESRGQTAEVRQVLENELKKTQQFAKQQMERLQLSLDRANNDNAALHQVVEEIKKSRSWRITAPLRKASELARDLRPQRLIKILGSSWRIYKREVQRYGLFGFFARFPYYIKRRKFIIGYFKQMASGGAPGRWTFETVAAVVRPERLHPDLTGGISPIAASISVVIPTLNPGAEFPMLLRKLKGQQGVDRVEIVIVDSGSTDGSVEVAKQWGCTVVEIAPEEFTHSGSRNLGAEQATGDYLLFMVQDAYPIGAHWMYGMLRYLLDHAEQGLMAVSCAETPRSDSDMMYDSMIDTHYRFLGCRDQDRLGRLQGLGHMALRAQGQLSDVACLIRREDFARYRYRGDYAEDLDLGMRIIRDGKAVAMLSSVKVIHSHNRPAFYYLKRSFVDVVFLVAMFDDFPRPLVRSAPGLIEGIDRIARHLSAWLQAQSEQSEGSATLGEKLQSWLRAWRVELLKAPTEVQQVSLQDGRLEKAIAALRHRAGQASVSRAGDVSDDVQQFVDMFLGRVEHFGQYAASVYSVLDARLAAELRAAVIKIFAASAGSALGFAYVQFKSGTRDEAELVQWIFDELKAGV